MSLSGARIARTFGLRSAWFSIGQLSVSTSASNIVYGSSVRVVARAVATKGAVLQQRSSNGIWRTMRHVHGKTVLSLEPRASTAFRLSIAGANGAGVNVAVRPQLHVRALSPRLLGGDLLPRAAGPVSVWRRVHGVWRVVAHPQILPSGKFRTPLRLRPTVYRITAGDGAFAPVTKRLVVTRRMLSNMRR